MDWVAFARRDERFLDLENSNGGGIGFRVPSLHGEGKVNFGINPRKVQDAGQEFVGSVTVSAFIGSGTVAFS
jgi:hypothetical protein